MEWLSGWSAWLIGGFILLILETIIPGVFVMWWGLAAIIMAGIITLFPSLTLTWQAIIFVLLAMIFSLLWWKYQHSKDRKEDLSNQLNARDHAMIGMQGTIIEILENGTLRGKFGDSSWRVIGENLNVGDKVIVQRVEGITLFVSSL